MLKDIIKGVNIGFGFLLTISLVSFVYAVGFHPANEILSGDFTGTYNFSSATVYGIDTIPSGFIGAFNLGSCPQGWLVANGSSGTVDLRGEFIRGLDLGRGIDPARILGSSQTDDFKSHLHTRTSDGRLAPSRAGTDGSIDWHSSDAHVNDNGYYSQNTGSTGGSETRPRNIALLYCQKQ